MAALACPPRDLAEPRRRLIPKAQVSPRHFKGLARARRPAVGRREAAGRPPKRFFGTYCIGRGGAFEDARVGRTAQPQRHVLHFDSSVLLGYFHSRRPLGGERVCVEYRLSDF